MAHVLRYCVNPPDPDPDQEGREADPQVVYEELFADGLRTWQRKITFVMWLQKTRGVIKGFWTLYKINRDRLR